MQTARARRREARLLVAVATLGRQNRSRAADLDDLLALDFLLAHPATLLAFIDLDHSSWPEGARPSARETQSTEETFLRWKRSVALEAAGPMLGRLLARRLIAWDRDGGIAPTKMGSR